MNYFAGYRQAVALALQLQTLRAMCADEEEYERRRDAALLRSIQSQSMTIARSFELEIEYTAKGV